MIAHVIPFDKIARVECTHHDPPVTIDKAHKGADIVINVPLFEYRNGKAHVLSRFAANGTMHGAPDTWASAWGIEFHPKPVLSFDNAGNAPAYVGPFSYLVRDGKIANSRLDNAVRGRTALGLTDNSLVVYSVADNAPHAQKASTETLAQRMLGYGCTFAINLDGGASSQYISGGQKAVGRPVPGYLHIWLKGEENMTGKEFASLCAAQVGSGYVWGGLGYLFNQSRLDQLKKIYPAVYTNAYQTKAKKLFGKKVYDCVGLIKHFLWGNTGDGVLRRYGTNNIPDTTANGMLALCKKQGAIGTMPETVGLLVHQAGHVGVYLGGGKVVEARGIDYGVVVTDLHNRNWKTWGELPGLAYEVEPAQQPEPEPAPTKSITWAELADRLKSDGVEKIVL